MSEEKIFCHKCGVDISNITHEFYGMKMYCHSDCKIDELEQENKELRTRVEEVEGLLSEDTSEFKSAAFQKIKGLEKRVAELEAVVQGADMAYKSAQRKVAELEKERDGLKKEIIDYIETSGKLHRREIQDMKDFKRQFTDVVIESLDKENKELQNRLSTLLKASEGLEKALVELDKLGRCWIQHNVMGSAGFISGAAVCEQTKPALADFRAVKENMEKGAGK